MKALILQCCETEDLGLYIDVLTDRGVRLRLVRAHREPIPAVTDYDVLMIGGTPDAAIAVYIAKYIDHNRPNW